MRQNEQMFRAHSTSTYCDNGNWEAIVEPNMEHKIATVPFQKAIWPLSMPELVKTKGKVIQAADSPTL